MVERSRSQVVVAVVGSIALIAAGCGTQAGLSAVGPSQEYSPGLIETAPAGVIVHTSVVLQSNIAKVPWHYGSDPSGSFLSYSWDFGDGTIATGGESISHVYATEGTFIATVTASSSEAGSRQGTSNILVSSHARGHCEGPRRCREALEARPQLAPARVLTGRRRRRFRRCDAAARWPPRGRRPATRRSGISTGAETKRADSSC
jgi:PKD domain